MDTKTILITYTRFNAITDILYVIGELYIGEKFYSFWLQCSKEEFFCKKRLNPTSYIDELIEIFLQNFSKSIGYDDEEFKEWKEFNTKSILKLKEDIEKESKIWT